MKKKIISFITAAVMAATVFSSTAYITGFKTGDMTVNAKSLPSQESITEITSESTTYINGDISLNGELELHDIIEIAKSLTGQKTFTDDEKEIADINNDGVVSFYDMVDIGTQMIDAGTSPSNDKNEYIDIENVGIDIGDALGYIETKDNIEVPLKLNGNIDCYALYVEFEYDTELTFGPFNLVSKALVSKVISHGKLAAIFFSTEPLTEDLGTIQFNCPDKTGTYEITATVKAFDYNGTSYVTNPIATSGTAKISSLVNSETPQGDITGDGNINLYDAIEICKYIMGMKTLTSDEEKMADFDGNDVVDLYDAIGIAKKLLE